MKHRIVSRTLQAFCTVAFSLLLLAIGFRSQSQPIGSPWPPNQINITGNTAVSNGRTYTIVCDGAFTSTNLPGTRPVASFTYGTSPPSAGVNGVSVIWVGTSGTVILDAPGGASTATGGFAGLERYVALSMMNQVPGTGSGSASPFIRYHVTTTDPVAMNSTVTIRVAHGGLCTASAFPGGGGGVTIHSQGTEWGKQAVRDYPSQPPGTSYSTASHGLEYEGDWFQSCQISNGSGYFWVNLGPMVQFSMTGGSGQVFVSAKQIILPTELTGP